MKKVSDDFGNISINTIIAKQQSDSSFKHNNFSSLINHNEAEDEKDNELSNNLTHQQQTLHNQAYLNKIFLTSVA